MFLLLQLCFGAAACLGAGSEEKNENHLNSRLISNKSALLTRL